MNLNQKNVYFCPQSLNQFNYEKIYVHAVICF